ncbi:class I SAM-dependent methyltransferase [Mucilaginibacter xinganensis]|uniref:Methyltransferase domain-containing protein n=1 Tax=Mucilaginibacter xinganensis TaxID=1234841 RepID=A0A223P2F3_9SPHI|nr:class I SAM-dependent methyltransferase [Mucilaginibacter xinganensis]ASU36287.1 Methyltransferase domain-containing protein [Mucilaginibacter xinganensis]
MKSYPFSHFPPVPAGQRLGSNENSEMDNLNGCLFRNDAEFDWLYPKKAQLLSLKHWSPLSVAHKAAEFLAEPGARVLDIGSGIGKFCLTAGYHFPASSFYGVEQRLELIDLAEKAKKYTRLSNVNFIHGNITQIHFKEFDHFYFYNSFYENLDPVNQIDDTIELSESLYSYYTQYLYNALYEKPPGTRLVTFHSLEQEIHTSYKLVDFSCDTLLKMWIKQ